MSTAENAASAASSASTKKEKQKIFLVHYGFNQQESMDRPFPNPPLLICSKEKDANEIARFLSDSMQAHYYREWVAHELLCKHGAKLVDEISCVTFREYLDDTKWKDKFKKHMSEQIERNLNAPQYTVTSMRATEDEIEKIIASITEKPKK